MLPAVFLDGLFYTTIAVCGSLATQFGSEEAARFIGAQTLFWLKTVNNTLLATATALKMFRSTAFAEHQAAKEEKKP